MTINMDEYDSIVFRREEVWLLGFRMGKHEVEDI